MGSGKVELFAAIRWDHQKGLGVRELARRYEVHRRTVRQAIGSPVPPDRKVPVRAAPVLDAVASLIDQMLREDLDAPRKQRHTARRIFGRLRDEHDAGVSYSYVAKYAGRRRAEIAAEARAAAGHVAGFVPQAKEPGAEAEVDFGDVTVSLAGELTRCFMVSIRKSRERARRRPAWPFQRLRRYGRYSCGGLSVGRWLCPGAEVFGAGHSHRPTDKPPHE